MADQDMSKIPFKQRVTMAQKALKAPKGQYNSFGKYKYRSAEDILEAIKPVNDKYHLTLTLTDDIEIKGDRVYLKATANLLDQHSDEHLPVSALAREPQSRKGMDESQVTGGASSYARKYALNGLYLIDDTKEDPDVPRSDHKQKNKQQSSNTFSERRGAVLNRMIAFDKAHDKDEGDTFKYIVHQKANAEDVTEQNIKFIEDNMTFLENQYNK